MFSLEKLKAMLSSRRFGLAAVAVLVVILQDWLGLMPDQAVVIAGLFGAWIFGDAIRKT